MMKRTGINVYLDREFVLNYLEDCKTGAFADAFLCKLVQHGGSRLFTTFTDHKEHFDLKQTPSSQLGSDEQRLQKLLNHYKVQNGKEVIEGSLPSQGAPDFIIVSGGAPLEFPGSVVIHCQQDGGCTLVPRLEEKVRLERTAIKDYLEQLSCKQSFHTVRIEDPYVLHGFAEGSVLEEYLRVLQQNPELKRLEVHYSDYYPKFRAYYSDETDMHSVFAAVRTTLEAACAAKGISVRFYNTASHDRYFCTNTALYIFGTSLTSRHHTHITYYPLLDYHQEYFSG